MGLDAATESLRWGVNDLGGTLMEENISRIAGSRRGVPLEPEQLIRAARAAGRDARPADDAVRDRQDVLAKHIGPSGPSAWRARTARGRRRHRVPGGIYCSARAVKYRHKFQYRLGGKAGRSRIILA